MRIFAAAMAVAILAPAALPQQGREARVPVVQNCGDVTAPMPRIAELPPRVLDPQHVMEEAAQLERMAAELRPQLERAAAGAVNADLRQKLKELEKLAKHLRNELDQ